MSLFVLHIPCTVCGSNVKIRTGNVSLYTEKVRREFVCVVCGEKIKRGVIKKGEKKMENNPVDNTESNVDNTESNVILTEDQFCIFIEGTGKLPGSIRTKVKELYTCGAKTENDIRNNCYQIIEEKTFSKKHKEALVSQRRKIVDKALADALKHVTETEA